VEEFKAAGVPCGPIYSIDQAFADAQVEHLGIAPDMPNAEGRHIRLVGQPFMLSRTPSKMAARPPEFGEQTGEILAEFGFTNTEIASLRQANVVWRSGNHCPLREDTTEMVVEPAAVGDCNSLAIAPHQGARVVVSGTGPKQTCYTERII
jgi:CoA-transferase family III